MISNFNTFTRTNLVFPLSRHDFAICSRYFQASIKTGCIMCVTYNSSKANWSACWAVIRSLGSWEASIRPSKWPIVNMRSFYWEQSVFLLNSKPWLWFFYQIHNLFWKVSEVCICWDFRLLKSVNTESLTQYKHIVSLSKRVRIKSYWLYHYLWVSCLSLSSWRSVIIPFREILQRSDFLLKGSLFWSNAKTWAINPDVLSNYFASLIKVF